MVKADNLYAVLKRWRMRIDKAEVAISKILSPVMVTLLGVTAWHINPTVGVKVSMPQGAQVAQQTSVGVNNLGVGAVTITQLVVVCDPARKRRI